MDQYRPGLSGRIAALFIGSKLTPLIMVGALLLGLFAVVAFAGTETGEMQLEEGFVDPQSGVKVDKVVTDPTTGMQEVTLK